MQDDPSLAGVLNESMADRVAEKLGGKKVRDVLPEHPVNVPSVDADDTIIEVAATMARLPKPAFSGDEEPEAARRDHCLAAAAAALKH